MPRVFALTLHNKIQQNSPTHGWMGVRLDLTLVTTALFFHVKSLPLVTLNLVAQVTWDLAMKWRTPSPFPPPQLLQGPRHTLYRHNIFQYCLCCPAKLAIIDRNMFTFFYMLKKTIRFGPAVAMSRALSLPPPCTQDTITKSCVRQVRTGGGGCDITGPIFPT